MLVISVKFKNSLSWAHNSS